MLLDLVKKERTAQATLVLFIIFSLWWGYDQIISFPQNPDFHSQFAHVYWIMSALGGWWGMLAAKKWGGFKSIMGKAISFFSLGLWAQSFGQFAYSFYFFVLKIDVPYPSIGDLGFFGSIPLYILGIWFLAKASGVKIGFRSYASKIQSAVIPALMLFAAYYLFLQGYEFDWSAPLTVFLDFGYPLGQGLYVSFALLAYLLSRNVLGGIMRPKILFILFALLIQFIADYMFLYQAYNEIWYPGGLNDYTYLVAYTAMTVGLFELMSTANKLKHSNT